MYLQHRQQREARAQTQVGGQDDNDDEEDDYSVGDDDDAGRLSSLMSSMTLQKAKRMVRS